ncbi:MAG: GntR family transcriptional regulator [Gammaproteobacteria bacterium]|jgi:GntR family transcriptional regulator|nr:GntR family transcriptional regulator [Gammaproteobacteria bacterium]
MDFQEQKAIYLQIAELIEERILTQKWQDRIPAIRELAAEIKVNPNTVARTYSHLETQGFITTQRGVGYFVAPDAPAKILAYRKDSFLKKTAPQFLKTMHLLNIKLEDLRQLCQNPPL